MKEFFSMLLLIVSLGTAGRMSSRSEQKQYIPFQQKESHV